MHRCMYMKTSIKVTAWIFQFNISFNIILYLWWSQNTKHLNQVVFNYSDATFPQRQQYITDFCYYRLNKSYFISVLHCKPPLDLLIVLFSSGQVKTFLRRYL